MEFSSWNAIVCTTLHFLYLFPCFMEIGVHGFWQLALFCQFTKLLYKVFYRIFWIVHIVKILPVPVDYKVAAHGFRQLQEHQCSCLVFSCGKQLLDILVLFQHPLPNG